MKIIAINPKTHVLTFSDPEYCDGDPYESGETLEEFGVKNRYQPAVRPLKRQSHQFAVANRWELKTEVFSSEVPSAFLKPCAGYLALQETISDVRQSVRTATQRIPPPETIRFCLPTQYMQRQKPNLPSMRLSSTIQLRFGAPFH